MNKKIRLNIFITEELDRDIRTIKCVKPNESLSEIASSYIQQYIDHLKKTEYWNELKKIELTKQKREEYLIDFNKYLIEKSANE